MKVKTPEKQGMKRSRTPWAAKLRPDMQPAVVPDPKGRGQLLLPTPLGVAEEIATVPEGSLMTVPELRDRLARRFDADLTCPLMTGIFYNIVAGAAEEQIAAGLPPLAPYWRVIPANGTLSPKTPAGPERQAGHLRQEGHTVTARRASLVVVDFQKNLVTTVIRSGFRESGAQPTVPAPDGEGSRLFGSCTGDAGEPLRQGGFSG